uniref:Uncharacterized protein n=1 Tax=viral metagenome TaxID=1070528 RepID=A0A6M3L1U2_9ZZZZ
MGWGWNPADYLFEALRAISRWWCMLEDVPDYHRCVKFGPLTIHLCGTDEVMESEYRAEHGVSIPSTAGCSWAGGSTPANTQYEVWVRVRKTETGRRITDQWGFGHEMTHACDAFLRMAGDETALDNPDEAIKGEFYE